MEFDHAARLTDIFGEWPDFHDAEVLRVSVDRGGPGGPTMDVMIHVFERTAEVDSAGLYVLKHHTQVTLRFTNVDLEGLAWIKQQDVLEDLVVTELDPESNDGRAWRIELVPSYGLGATLQCERAIVMHVESFRHATQLDSRTDTASALSSEPITGPDDVAVA